MFSKRFPLALGEGGRRFGSELRGFLWYNPAGHIGQSACIVNVVKGGICSMTRLLCVVSIALLCVLVVGEQTAWGAGELWISCDGIRSGGGGARAYQYTLKNTGAAPVTLTLFYLGTMDSTPGNYSAWVAPAGFNATGVVADWTTLFNLYQTSVMSTTMIKTGRGLLPPPMASPPYAGWWSDVGRRQSRAGPSRSVLPTRRTPGTWSGSPSIRITSTRPRRSSSLPIAEPVGTWDTQVSPRSQRGVSCRGEATLGRIKARTSSGQLGWQRDGKAVC